jgi:hypothetical protein
VAEEHSAIRWLQTGRGLGITTVPVVDIGLTGKQGKIYHILDPNSPICNTRGQVRGIERGVDPKVVSHNGKVVCARCIAALGPIPMPALTQAPLNERTQ